MKVILLLIPGLFLVSVFGLFFFHDRVRRNRRLYRFGYAFTALTGMTGAILLTLDEQSGSMDRGAKIIMIVFVLIVGVPVFLYNTFLLLRGEGEILTSTLTDCSVSFITGGKFRQRVSIRLEGTSLEGNKDSFLLRYPPDKKVITDRPVTPDTQITVRYYSGSFSIYEVSRNE